jgi:flagellar hook protein FlgE
MSTAFSNALSGLNANALAIDTVSGNLANLNTSGYKNNQVSFNDVLTGSINGEADASVGGSVIASSSAEFQQGSVTTTGAPFDAAIQGSGFFVLATPAGQLTFTRAGNFTEDSSGNLLGASGEFVQGWNAVGGVLIANGPTSSIKLPVGGSEQPIATTEFNISANLDANAVVGATSGTFSTPVQVFDAEGTSHTLTVTFTETAPDNWNYTVTIPSADLTGGSGTDTTVASGALVFNGSGTLASPLATDGPINIPITGLADGASDLSINWNLYDSNSVPTLTQFSEPSANLASSQNGTASGQLTGTSISDDGKIIANYSNGTSQVIAQIALASVLNPNSMQNLGSNTFGVTAATATPIIGTAGTGSRGQITGGALESSTVDIATEFTNLLTYERGYQANSKVITTEDNITQTTVSLIQG